MVLFAVLAADLRSMAIKEAAIEEFEELFPMGAVITEEPTGLVAAYDGVLRWTGFPVSHRQLIHVTIATETSPLSDRHDQVIKKLPTAESFRVVGVSVDLSKFRVQLRDGPGCRLSFEHCKLEGSSFNPIDFQDLRHLELINCSDFVCDAPLGVSMPNLESLKVLNSTGISEFKLGKLKRLRQLGLSGTAASETVLQQLELLVELEELSIGPRAELDADLNGLSRLQKLTNLRLDFLVVSDELMRQIASLPNLQRLELFDCSGVTDEGMKHLEGHSKLEFLALRGLYQVTDQSMNTIGSLAKLRELDLTGTKLTGMFWSRLAELPELKKLHVHGDSFTADDICKLAVGSVSSLVYKTSDWLGVEELSRNDIELISGLRTDESRQLRLRHIHGLRAEHLRAWQGKLLRIDLRGCQFDESVMELVSQMKSFEELDLSSTNVTSSMLRNLDSLSNLQVLNLERTKIDVQTLEVLKRMPRLKRVDLGGTGLYIKQ